ncbi:Sexual differentiation process protein isp4, partial [Tolypocladium capitatum]
PNSPVGRRGAVDQGPKTGAQIGTTDRPTSVCILALAENEAVAASRPVDDDQQPAGSNGQREAEGGRGAVTPADDERRTASPPAVAPPHAGRVECVEPAITGAGRQAARGSPVGRCRCRQPLRLPLPLPPSSLLKRSSSHGSRLDTAALHRTRAAAAAAAAADMGLKGRLGLGRSTAVEGADSIEPDDAHGGVDDAAAAAKQLSNLRKQQTWDPFLDHDELAKLDDVSNMEKQASSDEPYVEDSPYAEVRSSVRPPPAAGPLHAHECMGSRETTTNAAEDAPNPD